MAHTKSSDPSSKLTREINRGYRSRRIKEIGLIIAKDRTAIDADSHILADVIDGEVSCNKSIMIAPCKGKILRVYTNAINYPSTSGAVTLIAYKAVIGAADVALNAAMNINDNAATDETALDGVLSTVAGALEFDEGQLIYVKAALSATSDQRSDALIVGIEWVPTER
jgi:hypothetical protein